MVESQRSRRKRMFFAIAIPLVLLAGCAALLIPRAPVEQVIAEDGTYEVGCFGCDMGEGTWRTTGLASPEGGCRWWRKTSKQIPNANVIESGRVMPGETATVRINDGEWFAKLWCGSWTRVER